jgi:hypothetical protein
MSVSLSVQTSVSGGGVSGSWITTTNNTEAHVLSEPGPSDTLYLAATAPTYTIKWTTGSPGKFYNTTGAAFTFTAEPAGWTGLTNGQLFTIYWTDAAGVQQYAYSVAMNATGTFPARTWTATDAACGGESAVEATNAQSNAVQTTMFNVVIAPETVDAALRIPGTDGTTENATPVLAAMFASSSRVSLIVLKDSNATPTQVAMLLGPYSGVCWTGTGTNPIATLDGSGGGTGTANKGATNALYSTADTSVAGTVNVVWFTDS